MYQVILYQNEADKTGTVIHSSFAGGTKLTECELNLKTVGIDEFRFRLNVGNPGFDHITPLKSQLIIFKDNQEIFKGRVIQPEREMSDSGYFTQAFVAESELAYLHDSAVRFLDCRNLSIQQIIATLIDNHNQHVESFKQFKIGKISPFQRATGLDEYIKYKQTYEALKGIQDKIGGFFRLRKEGDVKYLDYLEEIGEKRNMRIAIKSNLKSANIASNFDELVTRIVPVSKNNGSSTSSGPSEIPGYYDEKGYYHQPQKIERETSSEDSPKTGIASVNGGIDYLDNAELQAEFGIIERVIEFESDNPSEIKAQGQTYINNQSVVKEGWEVEVVDLQLISESEENLESLNVGDMYLFSNPILSGEQYIRISAMEIDLNNPQLSRLTIGEKQKTLTEYQNERMNQSIQNIQRIVSVQNVNDQMISNLEKQNSITEINQKADLNELVNRGYYQISSSHLNTPQGFTGGLLNVIATNEMVWQNLQEINGNQYARVKNQDTWSIWRKNAWEVVN